MADSARPPKHRLPPAAWVALGIAALLACAWPYAALLPLWPQTTDGSLWISRGAFTNSHWAEWICCKPHFVFYRPTAALSYTLNYAVGGFEPWGYRLTDVAIHLSIGVLIYALYREFQRQAPRWPAAVAAGVFLLHPVAEEIVPVLARRGYGLMTAFGALSVLAFARACRRDRVVSWPAAATGLCFAAAVFATEVNFVLAPLYPILAYHLTWRRDRPAVRPLLLCTLPLASALGAYLLRLAILGDHGGYDAAPTWSKLAVIVRSSWEYLLFPTSATGRAGFAPLGTVGIAAVLAWYTWKSVVQPLRHFGSRESRLPLVLVIWIGGYTALSVLFGVWFFRQAYPALVPLSLLVAWLLHDTLAATPRRRLVLALAVVPQALLLASLVYHSPVLRGLDPVPQRTRLDLDARMRALDRDLARVEDPARIYLVMPRETLLRAHPLWSANVTWRMSLTRYWVTSRNQDRDLQIRNLALVGDPGREPGERAVERVMRHGREALEFAPGVRVQFPGSRSAVENQTDLADRVLWLDLLPVPEGMHGYVYYYQGNRGVLVPIPEAAGSPARTPSPDRVPEAGAGAAVVPDGLAASAES